MKPVIIDIQGIGPAAEESLAEHGYRTLRKLAGTTVEKLATVPGFSEARAGKVIAAAAELLRSESGEKGAKGKQAGKEKKGKKDKRGKKDKKGKKGKKGKKDKKGKKGKKGKKAGNNRRRGPGTRREHLWSTGRQTRHCASRPCHDNP